MKKKKKIITHKKSYPLEKSPLFKTSYINRLLDILEINRQTFDSIIENKEHLYHLFTQGKREIQKPINELYNVHNRIASLLLRITQPDFVFSGIRGRSYIENAKEHVRAKEMLTTDITSFFPSTRRKMIFWFFKENLQCSYKIANFLADLCSIDDHLPTGSQISIPLAFWVNSKMFDELNLLATKNNLKMTLYVDDITFSGDKIPKGFKYQIEKIINKHRHNIKLNKTTLYKGQSVKEVTGLILQDGDILPPNRQFKKLYLSLNRWKNLISEKGNGEKIEWQYPRIIGLLNNISYFKPEYKSVIYAIHKEFYQYKNMPSNYKKLN
ncbi:hypothetical protein A1D23_09460 [Chelonobacter oris]|uniref:reverse transcriptase family protein n=1 Tax=Chelonobacter oris TaxID=505317 RepID=UPI0024469022|nr:reverse transcriptase family protein [Chelonobacter oris]MDH3000647.1 hypothetical protein [Chelonobacter oris]